MIAMYRLWMHFSFRRLSKNRQGQDLMEYALMTCFVALAVYGFLPNNYVPSLSHIWSRVNVLLSSLGGA